MADIQSAYLNEDQERKLDALIDAAEELTGVGFRQGVALTKEQKESGYGTIRVVLESMQARDALVRHIAALKSGSIETEIERLERIVRDFDVDVYAHEIEQLQAGTQKFVAERDEASQV